MPDLCGDKVRGAWHDSVDAKEMNLKARTGFPNDFPTHLGDCQFCGQPGTDMFCGPNLEPAHFSCVREKFPEEFRSEEQIEAEEFIAFNPEI